MSGLLSRMRPTGAAINEDALQEVDFGLGEEGNKAVDKKKLYDQHLTIEKAESYTAEMKAMDNKLRALYLERPNIVTGKQIGRAHV